jgi:archaellum component FlaF (FlaF/FlaG flagellin family)
MGGSVAAGAMIVGTSLLVVFALAMSTLNSQVESGLSELETAAEPIPSFTIDSATNIGTSTTGAVVDFTINDGGTGYTQDALVETSSDTWRGFNATLVVDSFGEVTDLVITAYGSSYLYSSSFQIDVVVDCTPTCDGNLDITATLGNVVQVQITNDGNVDMDTDYTWIFENGQNIKSLSDQFLGDRSNTIFPGETFTYDALPRFGGQNLVSGNMAVTCDEVTKSITVT